MFLLENSYSDYTLRQTKQFIPATVLLTLLLGGCSVHDVIFDPAPSVRTDAAYSMGPIAPLPVTPWYADFNDAYLSALIDMAYTQNFNVRAAIARLEAAEAVYRQSNAARLPMLSAEASIADGLSGSDGQETSTAAGVALDWEADIFGRLRALAAADALEAEATANDIETVRLALSAEMAEAYYGAIAQAKQLSLLREQARLDKEFLDILDLRFEEGIGTRIDLLQQQGQLADTQSLIPLAQGARRIFENRMDVLLGTAPDAGNRVSGDSDFPAFETLPAIGVPSDILLNRPDLRALRDRLVAQDAEIAAAIADRLPRLSLTGSYAYIEGGTADGWVGSVLGSLVQPLITWGQRKAAVTENKALYEEQLAEFTQAYLEAIEDVENALYLEDRQRDYLDRLAKRQAILEETLSQTESVFRQGLSDYLPVLEALKDLRAIERQLIDETFTLIQYRIQLYRAVGGHIPPQPPLKENQP